jgi:glycosyltransferase involved in cell wall biosynthesis
LPSWRRATDDADFPSGDVPVKLSVIIVAYNMAREIPRALQSLQRHYQQEAQNLDYEVIVVDNGSSQPLGEALVNSFGPQFKYLHIQNAKPSPAAAINMAAAQATGDILALMIDGAHILTPGAMRYALDMFAARANPLVLLPAFFLGPGPQFETVLEGYDQTEEDQLLESINWPAEGYRLFEIGVPYRIEPGGVRPKLFWFVRLFESNCLFFRRSSFEAIGGCDERFDIPGGGFLLPDLYREMARADDAEPVQLLGEASFHQFHGGTSTNVSRELQKEKLEIYLRQYQAIRGEPFKVTKKPLSYYGHMPNAQARQLMITG